MKLTSHKKRGEGVLRDVEDDHRQTAGGWNQYQSAETRERRHYTEPRSAAPPESFGTAPQLAPGSTAGT
jgi:hypothetical protein